MRRTVRREERTTLTANQESDIETLDPRTPEARVAALMDPGTVAPLRAADSSGAYAARGRIDGTRVIAYCTDATKMGGAMGVEGCRHIVEAIDTAVRERAPVVGVWHCSRRH